MKDDEILALNDLTNKLYTELGLYRNLDWTLQVVDARKVKWELTIGLDVANSWVDISEFEMLHKDDRRIWFGLDRNSKQCQFLITENYFILGGALSAERFQAKNIVWILTKENCINIDQFNAHIENLNETNIL